MNEELLDLIRSIENSLRILAVNSLYRDTRDYDQQVAVSYSKNKKNVDGLLKSTIPKTSSPDTVSEEVPTQKTKVKQ